MRTLLVGLLAFIALVTLLWAMGGFISAIWNPMAWNGFGRLILVLTVLGIALPLSSIAAIGFYEEIEKPRSKRV